METQLRLICVVLLITGLAACKKNNHSTPTPATDICVLGVKNDSVFTWENGTLHYFYSQSRIDFDFGPSSLALKNHNVYVAGWQATNTSVLYPVLPTFWLNGSAQSLADSTGVVGNGTAMAVALSGTDVYFAGVRDYDNRHSQVPFYGDNGIYPTTGSIATLWKNGTPTALPNVSTLGVVDPLQDAVRIYEDYVSGLFVSGANVYVAGGSLLTTGHARYWVNGRPTDLDGHLVYTASNNRIGFPTTSGICASGTDVYVSGSQATTTGASVAIYWKDSTLVFLSTDSLNGSVANGIAVSGSDVYVVGWQNIGNYSRAILWKNGSPTTLTTGDLASAAMSVCLHGNDVYVAGYTWKVGGVYVAAYWKNGVRVDLTDGSSPAIAYSLGVE